MVQYLETGSGNEAALAALRSERCSEEALRSMFSGMHTIVTAALRQPKLKPEVGVVRRHILYRIVCYLSDSEK